MTTSQIPGRSAACGPYSCLCPCAWANISSLRDKYLEDSGETAHGWCANVDPHDVGSLFDGTAACFYTCVNRTLPVCSVWARRPVAKIAAARRLKARKSDPRRMCSQRHHAAPHSRAPRAAHRAPSRAAKGPRPGPGPVPTGQRPTRARRRRFGALFRANAPCAFSGNPHARSLARSASGGARRPAAGAIDAKKSALQAAASTASARAPAAPHGPGERAGQSFARARALARCQRAAPRNRLAHRRAAGHTCRGRWMPRRQRPARAARRAPAPAGRRPRRRALPSSPDFSPQFLFYFRGHSGAFDPTPGCNKASWIRGGSWEPISG